MANIHTFTNTTRKRYAICSCGWAGKPTKDKQKSWRAHVRRVTG